MSESASAPVTATAFVPRRWVVMHAAGQDIAIDALSVREIHDGWQAMPLPGTAAWFLGTLVVRGRVVPVTSFDAWLDPEGGRRAPPFGVEVTVGGDAYLLAVSDVRHAMDASPDREADRDADRDAEPAARSPAPAGSPGALAGRGVRVERRTIGGLEMDTFTAGALIAAPAFGDVTASR